MGLTRATICQVRQCIETRKTAKKKGRKRTTSSIDARKEEEPALQDHQGKKGVTSTKLAEKMTANRCFVDRIVREAAVRRCKTESDVLSLGKSWNRGKRGIVERTRAENAHFWAPPP